MTRLLTMTLMVLLSTVVISPAQPAAAATASASSELNANTAATNAVDGNLATGWVAATAADGQWLTVNLGKLHAIEKVQQTFAVDGMWGFRIEGSIDNANWATLVDRRAKLAGKTFAESVSGLYQYVRLTVTSVASGQSASSQELLVSATDQGTNLAGRGSVTASSWAGNYEPSKATDGATGTYWGANTAAYPQWLKVDLGGLYWLTGIEQQFKDYDRFGFRIEASVDDSGWAVLIDRQAGFRGQTFQHATQGNYRYVRLTLLSSQSGFWAGSVEFKIFGFANEALGKAASSSSATSGHAASAAVNGNTADYWEAANAASTQTLQVNLGGLTAVHQVEQLFNSAATWRYTIEGSINGTTWVMLADRSAGHAGQQFTDRVSGGFRHIRLSVLPSGSVPTSRELRVHGTPVARNLAPRVRAMSSSHGPGYEAARAVDGNATSYWGASSPALPQTLTIDLGNESILHSVEQSFVDSGMHNFTIHGSRDNSIWTMLLDASGGRNGRVFTAGVSGVYRYLRLHITYSAGHWASSQELKAIGIGSPVTARWWEESGGIMRYFPKYYNQRLTDIRDGLAGLKAQGYSGIDLSAVWPGPTHLWAGLAVNEFTAIDPNIGTMADFESLIATAHSLGMYVHLFMNPGYTHVTSSFFQKAERDYRDRIDSEERAWFDFSTVRHSDKWIWSPTAGAYFYAAWHPELPSFHWGSARWRAKAREVIKFWAQKGVDGMGFDAPSVYHHNDSPAINNEVIDVARDYDIMLNPEGIQTWPEYDDWATAWHYNTIHDLEVTHWGGCGRSILLNAMNNQNVLSPTDLDMQLKLSRDAVNAVGGVTMTPMGWEVDGVPGNTSCPPATTPDVPVNKRLLEAATLTTMGTLFFLHNGHHEIVPTDKIATWPAADRNRLIATIKAQSAYDGLAPSGLRVKLPTNDNAKYLALKRTNKDGSVAALAILNYQNSSQQITVNLADSGIAIGQAPIDLIAGTAAAPINSAEYKVTLPAYGFTVLAVEQSRVVATGNRIESYNSPGSFWRHRFGQARVDGAAAIVPHEDSRFRIVPGLAGTGTVSFESVNFPGTYLRHQSGLVYLHPFADTALYRADASFTQVPGLAAATGFVSFRSHNFPTHYLRKDAGGFLRIDPAAPAMYADATYRVTSP